MQLPAANAAEPLARLRHNEAVGLFIERAAAASGGFELTALNQAAVVDLCRRLDGLPLAIELAAVRTRALSAEQIRDRLSSRFDLLTGGSRAALPRHQTLRATIEWSYGLLAPAERTLLTRLSVFAGRFRLDDVEAVCCFEDLPAARALDLLSSLLDKSLVIKENAADAACYRLHETMREYAGLKLRGKGEEDTVERRCADHYLSRCRQFALEGRYRLLEWLPWIELEIDNVRAVLGRCIDRADHQRAVDLATCLIWYWITRATTEGVRWLDEILARDAAPAAHPWAYFARGFLAVLQSDPAAAIPVLDRAATAARAAGQPDALAQSLAMASIAANMAGDRPSSIRLLRQARSVADGLDDLGATLMTHQAQALNGLLDGDVDAVRSAAADGARLSRTAGDLYSLAMMLTNQGFAALMSGHLREAEQRFAEGLRIADRVDDRVAQCFLLGALGCCAAGSGEPRLAAQLLGAMDSLRAEMGASIHAAIATWVTQAKTSATAALGSSRFGAEFRAGQQLSRDAAVRRALRQAVPAAATAAPHGTGGLLGPREANVARLVTDGLSNREIGARLFISERTVESHVRNIMNKLGVDTRAQIAGWMAQPDQ